MPSRKRPELSFRVQVVPDRDASRSRSEALRLLGHAFADLLIEEAKDAIAARLGVSPASLDREAGVLKAEDLGEMSRQTLRGAA